MVTRQNMDDFGLNNIDDVMRHTPGITVSAYDTDRNNYYARGFDQQLPVRRIPRRPATSATPRAIRSVTWPSTTGWKYSRGDRPAHRCGSLGATINLIRKKPTHEFKGHVELGAGSWDNYRSELDVSGPLTESGNVRGRAVAAHRTSTRSWITTSAKPASITASSKFDLNPDTMLTVGADYQDNDPKGSVGQLPASTARATATTSPRPSTTEPSGAVGNSTPAPSSPTSKAQFRQRLVGKVQLDHKINGYHAPLGAIMGDWPAPDNSAKIVAQKYTGETKSNSLDIYLTGPFQFLGREHELVVGTSASFSHWEGKSYGTCATTTTPPTTSSTGTAI